MKRVDFGYVYNGYAYKGSTIYRMCFNKYITSRFVLERMESKWSKVVTETEAVFDFLVKQGIDNGYDVDSILETPTLAGETCFDLASRCSEKICNYIIKRGIKVNNITTEMMVPDFEYPSLTIRMMENGINPHVIDCHGESKVDCNPSSFESDEAKRLLATFPRSVHYSIEDIECGKSCPADCNSSFKRFYCKNGSLVEMTDQNRIGSGGFGMVFRELFHGKPMAMKCMLMGDIESRESGNSVKDIVSDLEKNISEIRIQMAIDGSGIIVPVAFVRQQNQKQDGNGKWIAENYNIFIYPLYDCNLDEFHQNYFDQFTEEMIADIIHQCFIRAGSDRKII